MKNFTNLYSLSKTLRFELKPIGNTLENMAHIIEQDEHRAESYKLVKKIIDQYHRQFIEFALSHCQFTERDKQGNERDLLQEYYDLYTTKRDDRQEKAFEDIQARLRKAVVITFKAEDQFKRLDKKELIQNDLGDFVESEGDKILISEFTNFTTYFTGYNQNRMNMYSDEAKSTSIANRLITQNLPRFIDNIAVFEKVKDVLADNIKTLEEEFGYSICDFFQLGTYSKVLSQKDITIYNTIIGGRTEDVGVKKIQGLNEYINLYNQQVSRQERLPKFTILYKQILSDRVTVSFLPEKFGSDSEMVKAINDYYLHLQETTFEKLKGLLISIDTYDVSKIYLKADDLTTISQRIFNDYGRIAHFIKNDYMSKNPKGKRMPDEKYAEHVNNWYKKQYFSLAEINAACGVPQAMENYFAQLGAINTEEKQAIDYLSAIANAYTDVKSLLTSEIAYTRNLSQEKDNVSKIKVLLDELKNLQHFVKPLLIDSSVAEIDFNFYGEVRGLYGELSELTKLYDKVRNHLTRKPYSEEKVKLNFQNSTLLDGWDVNKETANTAVLLLREGLYYLAIMDKKHNRVFEGNHSNGSEFYQKVEYKLLPGANKMLPKVFFSEKGLPIYKPSKELLEKYQRGTHKKGDLFNIEDCHNLIDFFKQSIENHEDWKKFNFVFSDTKTYKDLSDFYREVESQGYKITYRNISCEYIDELVRDGKIYLFQIYNKDFSQSSKGRPNLHTMYWKMLFDESNLKDVVYKLNGQAEIFFRKSSIKYHVTHPANVPIKNKNIHTPKKESVFEYDLLKDRRYMYDKFTFHVPITMNFKSNGNDYINRDVNEYIAKTTDDIHVIGVDRGERHLLYFTVVNQRGEIVEQYSMNTITNHWNGVDYVTDYHQKLEEKNVERTKARQDWQTIENIKELKEGYLSQVVHKVAQLMEKYNAILVLEDLNSGFKRGRIKVEHQVYQRFEKQLIEKLNYLVFKDKDANAPGGLLRAYQWASKFESFERLGKQCGFIYYIPAWNTSKIDPITGFVNLLDTRYETKDISKLFFGKFDIIRYNAEKDWFEFTFDYDKFHKRAEGTRTIWTLCSVGKRIETYRSADAQNHFDSREVDLTAEFKALFATYNIDINGNLKQSIIEQDDKKFFESLYRLLRLTLQMRNSKTNSEVDYLISPVADVQGNFYNSDAEKSRGKDAYGNWVSKLPVDADANGAYNIARKGLMLIRQLKETGEIKTITNKDWLNFVQQFCV